MSRKRLTTEEFIKRARAVHGPQYDYSKVSYVNAETKVCIVCHTHGDFYQIPIMHIYGHGCKFCADENLRKSYMTTEEFVSKARKIHGNFYDYSKVLYKNTRKKVCIICPKHGEFYQKPNSHLQGKGCSFCKLDNQKLTQEQFIKRAELVHGKKYDYGKTAYKHHNEKICIVCAEHGKFFQNPSSHLKGHGCPACALRKISLPTKYSHDLFVKKSNEIHGGKFDYSKVRFQSTTKKVCIICPKHGEFFQFPYKHLRGHGCRECSRDDTRISFDDFIQRSNVIHGAGKYDYSEMGSFKNNKEKIRIICSTHGGFYQSVERHLSGAGCPVCARIALGRIKALSNEEFIKRATEIHRGVYDYSKVEYVNSKTEVCILCKIHGKFFQKPAIHLKTRGCPQCRFPLGERAIMRWFDRHGIEFKHHHSFPDLRGDKRPLVFDFYLPFLKSLIEYDGAQHHQPVSFNGIDTKRAVSAFRRNQYYDSLKDLYSIRKNRPLLRIDHREYKMIPKILDANFRGIDEFRYALSFVHQSMTLEQARKNVEKCRQLYEGSA